MSIGANEILALVLLISGNDQHKHGKYPILHINQTLKYHIKTYNDF